MNERAPWPVKSVSDHSVCPNCKAKEQARVEELERDAIEQYGILTIGGWLTLRDRALEARDNLDKHMRCDLREHFARTVMRQDGTFFAEYKAICDECAFEYEYHYEIDALSNWKLLQQPQYQRK